MKRRRNGKKGFTLMEVMVGIAIVAIISVPLLNMFATSFKVGRYSYNIDNANAVALTTVEKLRSGQINFTLDGSGNYTQTEYFDYNWNSIAAGGEEAPLNAAFRAVSVVKGESLDSMQSAFLPQLVNSTTGENYSVGISYEQQGEAGFETTLELSYDSGSKTYKLACGRSILSVNGVTGQSEVSIPAAHLMTSSVLPVVVDNSQNTVGHVRFKVTGVSGVELGLFVFGDDGESELVSMSVISGGASITHLEGGMDMLSFDRLDINVKVIREADGLVISDYATKSYVLPYTEAAGGVADEGGEEVP
ncbi:MAG: prepilin-type N-terminal cleavage/methylation domain-containing protein [Clostridiaceae bacterium]|nr:prepilin-type N-terminal cleavage/methylation domain-containing protein [Eubacteriales bacterium]